MDPNKKILIDLFREHVKGRKPDLSGRNIRHDGREGHWLEEQFGKHPDADNHADFFGYELKNETTSKTTFGDWSANEYIYKKGPYAYLFEGNNYSQRQNSFCYIFGSPNPKRNNRYSWSGRPCPTIHEYNEFGQILVIEPNDDIVAYYSYSEDFRPNKDVIVPNALHLDNIEIARWYGYPNRINGSKNKCLSRKVEDKFGDKGWFTCKKDFDGKYQYICFGNPFTYQDWLILVDEGIAYLDSGMYQGNSRPYSMWRANNNYWYSLITETYE